MATALEILNSTYNPSEQLWPSKKVFVCEELFDLCIDDEFWYGEYYDLILKILGLIHKGEIKEYIGTKEGYLTYITVINLGRVKELLYFINGVVTNVDLEDDMEFSYNNDIRNAEELYLALVEFTKEVTSEEPEEESILVDF